MTRQHVHLIKEAEKNKHLKHDMKLKNKHLKHDMKLKNKHLKHDTTTRTSYQGS